VSNEGHCPSSSDPHWDRFFSIALMSRYAEDLAPTLSIMAGDNAHQLKLDQKVRQILYKIKKFKKIANFKFDDQK